MDSAKQLSSTVLSLRFPLMVLVVLIHSVPISPDMLSGDFAAYKYAVILIKEVFARVAVPAFFVFSGYYAFLGKDLGKRDVYLSEAKKKVRTLVIPYFLWNLLALVFWGAKDYLVSLLGYSVNTPFHFAWSELPNLFWFDCVNYSMWFVRDLIVMTLFTPVIYVLLRVTRGYFVLGLFILCLFVDASFHILGCGLRSFLFFSLGALVAMKSWDPIAKLKPLRVPSYVLWFVGTLTLPLVFAQSYFPRLEIFYLMLAMVSVVLLFASLQECAPRFAASLQGMNKYVFFIYGAHTIVILSLVREVLIRIPIFTGSSSGLILAYLLTAGIDIALTLVAYQVMKRWAPRLLSILCGGRIS